MTMTNNYILVGINMLPSDQLLIDYIKKNDSPGHIILIDPYTFEEVRKINLK